MVYNYTSDGKRIPTWETHRQEWVVCPHIIGGHGKLLYDGSVSVRHIVQSYQHM
jgi:hypothetical protein